MPVTIRYVRDNINDMRKEVQVYSDMVLKTMALREFDSIDKIMVDIIDDMVGVVYWLEQVDYLSQTRDSSYLVSRRDNMFRFKMYAIQRNITRLVDSLYKVGKHVGLNQEKWYSDMTTKINSMNNTLQTFLTQKVVPS